MYSDTKKLNPKATEALDHCELPSSIKDAEVLVKADTELKDAFSSKMAETLLSVDEVLESLKCQEVDSSVDMALDIKEPIKLMSSLKLISQDLKEMQKRLINFWQVHKAGLNHMTHACQFSGKAEKVGQFLIMIDIYLHV